MTPEKWQDTLANIKEKFSVRDEGKLKFEEEGGVNVDFVEFDGPMGKMRLEFVTKPVVLDRKTSYTRRVGSETKIDYIYSEEEKSHQLLAYKWSNDTEDWEEIEQKMFI